MEGYHTPKLNFPVGKTPRHIGSISKGTFKSYHKESRAREWWDLNPKGSTPEDTIKDVPEEITKVCP